MSRFFMVQCVESFSCPSLFQWRK